MGEHVATRIERLYALDSQEPYAPVLMAMIRSRQACRTRRRAPATVTRLLHLLIVALCLAIVPTAAQTAALSSTGCSLPLAACTQQRVAHLLTQSRNFARAAAMRPPASIPPREHMAINNFDNWLRGASARTRKLAQVGGRAMTDDMQTSFNMQYLTLQNQLQDESRRFALVSNIMRAKHDPAKNSIGNLR